MQAFLRAGGARSFVAFSSTNDSSSTVSEMQNRSEVGHLPDSETTFPMEEVEEYEDEILSEEESENDEEDDEEDESDNRSQATVDSLDASDVHDYFQEFLGNYCDDDLDVEVEDPPLVMVSSGHRDLVLSDTHEVSMDLYNQRALFQSQNIEGMPNSGRFLAHLDLLVLLHQARVPLFLYDEVLAWVKRCQSEYRYHHEEIPYLRSSLISELYTRFDMHGLQPIQK